MEISPRRSSPGSGVRRSVAGFTLIELMVVVAVVAILAAIAVPSYQEQVRKSRRGQAKADLVELAQRAERHHTTNNTYETFWDTVAATDRQSPRGGEARYVIGISAVDANSYLLTAVPQGAQARDTRCMSLTLSSTGEKDIVGGSGAAADCW
ncbi:type IV pilin protein [Luteimonas sp. RD2P54]|uniref:Type IV pilin protein n=1 Tax=Luteimonas endophytica TaxID=3042023 RepID=A0ABT6JAH5_9GAMM|nr:type IV pilin protein [Luteimonas endophytica]MDH5823824.1 type IV pilin protein [Luteimonas endophytica]